MTTDLDGAAQLCTKLFGWSSQSQQMGPISYTTFMSGDQPAAGMLEITADMGDVPPNWLVF